MLWHGDEWLVVALPSMVMWLHPMLWRDDKWLVMAQPHRGYTLDSPGLPTIGGYPGEQDGRDATPLGVVLSLCVLSNTSHVTIYGIASK